MKFRFTLFFLLLLAQLVNAQGVIKGRVTDLLTELPLKGVYITIIGESETASSDDQGKFEIRVNALPARLVFVFPNYVQEQVEVISYETNLEVQMLLDTRSLSEVVLVGSRFQPRSITESPVPIDNISYKDLTSNGQVDLDMMMMYNIPSFNASNQTVSDATAHMNPAGLRGLGPSRTLFLINGKRKGASALVYINDTPGKGEVGVDLKGIPVSAIDRVEVLRDGASAQYGSDAIAGVVNIILKEDVQEASVNLLGGVYQEGDGETFNSNVNFGFNIGSSGYVNLTANFLNQEYTNRPGDFTGYDSIIGLPNTVGAELERFPNGGMIVGTPEMLSNAISYNAAFSLSKSAEIYSFATHGHRKGKSFALYRLPTWSRTFADPANILGDNGFHPNFQTIVNDDHITIGIRGTTNLWNLDFSTTMGSNKIDYIIGNTVNASLGQSSPTTFQAGSYEFKQEVHNFDASKSFDFMNVAFGAEFRIENFMAHAGEEASYIGSGAGSFPGIRPEDEVDKERFNISFYADIEKEINDKFLINVAGRFEEYTDFGDKLTGKLALRYSIIKDKLNLRGSMSTGFRAPSLHQSHFSSVQTILVGTELTQQGTFNNESPIIRALGVPELKEETSENFGIGVTFAPNRNLFITTDLYRINVDDRIVFTGTLVNDDTTTVVGGILNDFGIRGMKFFTNAIDTETSGIDIVVGYDGLLMGLGKFNVTLAYNYNETIITSELKTPQILQNEGNLLFDRKEESRIEKARPLQKAVLKLEYVIGDWNINVNNTYFGEVSWHHADSSAFDQVFSGKIITDIGVSFSANKLLDLSLGVNNAFDIFPDEIDPKGDPVTNLMGRFRFPWEVNQFGFNGRFYYLRMRFKF